MRLPAQALARLAAANLAAHAGWVQQRTAGMSHRRCVATLLTLLALAAAPARAQDRWETLLDEDGVRADLDLGHVDRGGEYPNVYLRWFSGGSDAVYTVERQEVDCAAPRVRIRAAHRYRRDPAGDVLLSETGFVPTWTRYQPGTVEARILAATCSALAG